MGYGAPIIIEKSLAADLCATLFLLLPWEMTALHLDLDTHLGCRRGISTYAQTLASARIKK